MSASYCANPFTYQRRATREVLVGKVGVGGQNPIRVQSMITCDTMDTAASIQQTLDLVKVGCEIVRITAPTVKDAANLQHIKAGLLEKGCDVPLVADIHFKPEAAMEAAKWVEKVRINPGNYADSKKFKILEYTDEQYAAELARIRERFTPLVELCKARRVAMRIGTNHGSLSDRIMNRYGDTPLGMVESALEFARIARDLDFHAFVFSMKSSNPKVMIEAYRLLVARLNDEGADWNYPIHLGVTEAGDGEDARIKSAIGIGSLLSDGIGDTIRVSLTEDSVHEIPVAQALAAPFNALQSQGKMSPAASASEAQTANYSVENGPTVPSNGPTVPSNGPAVPSNGPTVPSNGSTVPSNGPTVPSNGPTVPSNGPAVPSNGPAVPSNGPAVPSNDPAVPLDVLSYDPFSYTRRATATLDRGGVRLGGEELIRVFIRQAQFEKIAHKIDRMGDYKPEIVVENADVREVDPRDEAALAALNQSETELLVTVSDTTALPVIAAFRLLAARLDARHPILLKDVLPGARASSLPNRASLPGSSVETAPADASGRMPDAAGWKPALPFSNAKGDGQDFLTTLLTAATNIGSLLCDGIGDAILVQGEDAPGQALRLSYNILQAAGSRIFKTDYVACPSCGRTLFNLQETTARIKAATVHLKGVKIAIMGCIVNGPGEMADADFGYVGGAPGKINLYVGKTPVKFNIPQAEAVDRLQDLIREHGKWVDPAPEPAAAPAF